MPSEVNEIDCAPVLAAFEHLQLRSQDYLLCLLGGIRHSLEQTLFGPHTQLAHRLSHDGD